MKKKQIRAMIVGYALGIAAAAVVMLLSGCAAAPVMHTAGPAVIMDVRDAALQQYAPLWQAEIQRRFPNAVALLCHGGTVQNGKWLTVDDPGQGYRAEPVANAVRAERFAYPDRTIVVLCCNVDHLALHGFRNVYYFQGPVWCIPDRAVPTFATSANHTLDEVTDEHPNDISPRAEQEPDAYGNIFEAVSGE